MLNYKLYIYYIFSNIVIAIILITMYVILVVMPSSMFYDVIAYLHIPAFVEIR